ncbi:MAG: hypothetical protein ACI4KG_06265 [Oscillospiraceae bacterium]
MTADLITVLEQLYSSSGVPAAIADSDLNIIWRNAAADSGKSPLKSQSAAFIFKGCGGLPSEGTVSAADENGVISRFNVMKTGIPGKKDWVYVIEHIGSDDFKDLICSPDIKNYMTYLCARIRDSAGKIAISADEIDSIVSSFGSGSKEISDCLNDIYQGLLLVLREVVNPEQFYYTLDPYCDDSTMSVEDELKLAASDAEKVLGSSCGVSVKTDGNIYIRMNRSVFETITADMASECCGGRTFPDRLVFSAKKTASDRALISVRSFNSPDRKNAAPEFETANGRKLYFDFLCNVMCEKYGAVFTKKELTDGFSVEMEIDAIKSEMEIVKNASKFALRNERFCAMALCLADSCFEKRYKNIDIDVPQDLEMEIIRPIMINSGGEVMPLIENQNH